MKHHKNDKELPKKVNLGSDLSLPIENFLLGIIQFFILYFKTFRDYLFQTKSLLPTIQSYTNIETELTDDINHYVRPLTYATVGFITALTLYLWAYEIRRPGVIESGSPVISSFVQKINAALLDLKFTDLFLISLPLVFLAISLNAAITHWIFRLFKTQSSFFVLLKINGYFVGSLATPLGLCSLCVGLIPPTFYYLGSTLIALAVILWLTVFLVLFRHLQITVLAVNTPWWKTIFISAISIVFVVLVIRFIVVRFI
jgi:hypothetical protein